MWGFCSLCVCFVLLPNENWVYTSWLHTLHLKGVGQGWATLEKWNIDGASVAVHSVHFPTKTRRPRLFSSFFSLLAFRSQLVRPRFYSLPTPLFPRKNLLTEPIFHMLKGPDSSYSFLGYSYERTVDFRVFQWKNNADFYEDIKCVAPLLHSVTTSSAQNNNSLTKKMYNLFLRVSAVHFFTHHPPAYERNQSVENPFDTKRPPSFTCFLF